MSATPFETQVEFELPKGYIDKTGEVHKKGVMRLANAADEIVPLNDPRVKMNPGYLSILLLENLLLFVLQLVKPKKHRTGSVLSLICSLIKYAAFIAVICFGLTILGVNITTIIASIGILALIVGFSAESLIADIVT